MKDRLIEILILLAAWLIGILMISGCATNNESIVDIRDKPLIELDGWIIPFDIEGFKGYSADFKFKNSLWSALGLPQNQHWPFRRTLNGR